MATKKPVQHIIRKVYKERTSYVQGTLEDLISYFSYTLEIGNSWNNKINRQPKTIKSFESNLQKSYSEKEASCFERTSIDIVKEIPEGSKVSYAGQ